ncbi:MAG: hypothetical protein AAF683_09230 [Pseudomonadota bacterium]
MYIRFALQRFNNDSGVRDGLFSAAYELLESYELSADQISLLKEKLDWFEQNLRTPNRFNRSKSKGSYRRTTKGLSWFKDTAIQHISAARDLTAVLKDHGWFVDELTTPRPGYIVYEDEHQVVAEPFRETRA